MYLMSLVDNVFLNIVLEKPIYAKCEIFKLILCDCWRAPGFEMMERSVVRQFENEKQLQQQRCRSMMDDG